MEDDIKEIRDVVLNMFITMLIVYLVIVTYTYLQTAIPYNIYFIKINMQIILEILLVILILLYVPKLKNITYRIFEKSYSLLKSFSLGQKFVLIAIILLICSAIFLIKNDENYANAVAILSYYFLSLGVLNEFIDYILEKRINNKINIIKTFILLIILGLVIHYTSDIEYYFKYLDDLIIVTALIYIIKLKIKNKKKRN